MESVAFEESISYSTNLLDNTSASVESNVKRSRTLSLRELRTLWVQRYAALSRKELAIGLGLVLLLWTVNASMFFGINFWLWSFTRPGANSNYLSIWLPALVWALGYLVPVSIFKLVTGARSGNWSFAVNSKKAVATLILIGFLDSMGGLTAVYATMPTPIFLQTMIGATGPIWTFFLTKIFYPERARPFTVYPAVAFALVAAGIIISGAHQFSSVEFGPATNIFWVLIYLLSCILFACLLFVVWEESVRFAQRQGDNETRQSSEAERLLSSDSPVEGKFAPAVGSV